MTERLKNKYHCVDIWQLKIWISWYHVDTTLIPHADTLSKIRYSYVEIFSTWISTIETNINCFKISILLLRIDLALDRHLIFFCFVETSTSNKNNWSLSKLTAAAMKRNLDVSNLSGSNSNCERLKSGLKGYNLKNGKDNWKI